MTDLTLTAADREALAGGRGRAAAMAMRLIVAMAEVAGASHLIDVTRAHVDGCLFHGEAGLEFARRLAAAGGTVSVPTTLNVASIDLLHPELYRGDPERAALQREQMDAYLAMGCRPTWTCAPYQLPDRPAFGEQIAWAESNAIVFANSVLGARTDRYGDFVDICAAITGRVPAAGLHLDENRRADIVFRLDGIPDALLHSDVLFPILGYLIGEETARLGRSVPAVVGLPSAGEDQLKALGAAAASSGSIGMFHVVGITPEAHTLDAAAGEGADVVAVPLPLLAEIRDLLSTASDAPIGAVSLGTPHASLGELERLRELLAGRAVDAAVDCYVSTGRDVLRAAEATGLAADLREAGVRIVTDTCTYLTPIIEPAGAVMTDSAKWAFYAPGNLGVGVVFGSTRECVESAVRGGVWRDEGLWDG